MSDWFRSTPESERLLAEERVVLAATELICEAMERRGISRAELAAKIQVTPSEVSQRLSGRRNLSLRNLARMLHAMDFGIEGRLVDRAAGANAVHLRPRKLDWPGGESHYTNSAGIPMRLVKGALSRDDERLRTA
ncbi:helix-turn-helix domain-containing protein [Jiangella gansuensis]|uniref:helix-turn-helix domain-containing protein n=1 Tax=Jiangella gansuensis TaxID=281473 RepID=UPI0012FBF64F|nr:helix-turn-helix transcriptional regulator [Jiangella gansuensis]